MSETKTYTLDDMKQHTTESDCWLAIHGKVYNVTDFLDEHPGGYDIVVAATGKDATEDYEEIGHSSTATEMLEKYLVGSFAGGVAASKPKKVAGAASSSSKSGSGAALFKALLPLLFVALAIALYLQQTKA